MDTGEGCADGGERAAEFRANGEGGVEEIALGEQDRPILMGHVFAAPRNEALQCGRRGCCGDNAENFSFGDGELPGCHN